MALILYKNGVYNEYSTVADAPMWACGLTLEQLQESIRAELGAAGLQELPRRLKRAHKTGCSSAIGLTLEDCITTNRAGKDESHMPSHEFLETFLRLPSPDGHTQPGAPVPEVVEVAEAP
jgi:hypothetical protein